MARPTIPEARETLIKSFDEDPGFLQAYVLNAAVVLMDFQSERGGKPLDFQDPDIREEAASRVMSWLFSPRDLPPPLPALERVSSDSDMLG